MTTKIDKEKLANLVESFYNVTGIKVAVYDVELNLIFAYPESDSDFCTLIGKNEYLCSKCTKSTKMLCEKCAVEKNVIIEKCHAGLTEAVAPLNDGISIIGYIMFGQVRNTEDVDSFKRDVMERFTGVEIDQKDMEKTLEKILYYSDKQLDHASRLLNAIAGYIAYDKIIYLSETTVAYKIVEYIRDNLDKELSVDVLCKRFFVSRTSLYKIAKLYMSCGIAEFIKEERLTKAKKLLCYTNKDIENIAEETGFSGVDYFLRVFKKRYGISASAYRK